MASNPQEFVLAFLPSISLPESHHSTTEVMLGMILAPEHLERVIDRGPSAQQATKLKPKGKAEPTESNEC